MHTCNKLNNVYDYNLVLVLGLTFVSMLAAADGGGGAAPQKFDQKLFYMFLYIYKL